MSNSPQTGHYQYVRLKASLLGMVGSFVLFAAYLAVPPLGIFSGILAPFPISHNRVLHGRLPALIVLTGTTTALTALFGFFAGILYVGLCAVIGLLLPELLLRGMSGSRALFWTTTATSLLIFTGILAYSMTTGIDIRQLVSAEISSSMKQALALYEKGGISGEELDFLKRSLVTVADMLKRLYPSMVIAFLIIISGCNLMLLKRSAGGSLSVLADAEFAAFRNPDLLVWILIGAGFSLLLPDSLLTTPALNLVLLCSLLYLIQGMAVVAALTSRYSVPAMVRVLLYAILIIQPYLLTLIAGIGLFDLWVDFRTPKPQENL